MAPISKKTFAIALGASFFAAVFWAVLAWRTPTSTFHFAPFIAAGVGPYMAKTQAGRMGMRSAAAIVASSAAVVALAIGVLAAGDRLQGPTFWSERGALGEALLFTVIGAGIGLAMLGGPAAQPDTQETS